MGAVQVKVHRLLVQQDKMQPTKENGDELVWWKRVKARIDVTQGSSQGVFQAVLDLRARVLRFVTEEPGALDVGEVARAVVHEMASFATMPASAFLQERAQAPDGHSIWMTTEPELVSGLLHQVKEEGTFTPRPRAPIPPALRAVLGDILLSIDKNLQASFEWTQGTSTMHPLIYIHFDTGAWEAHKHVILVHLEAAETRRELVSFFDQTSAYVAILQRARAAFDEEKARLMTANGFSTRPMVPGPDPASYSEAAKSGVTQRSNQYQQWGMRMGFEIAPHVSDEIRLKTKHFRP